jgi:alpha-galactosidase
MGWNSWNLFACNINETLIRQTADVLADAGLVKLGYQYLNIDDCWQVGRDPETGVIIEDKKAFPSGIGALADYGMLPNFLASS